MIVDPYSKATIYFHHPVGLGRDVLKLEIPVLEERHAFSCPVHFAGSSR